MPSSPNKPCKRTGCPEITRNKAGYCFFHINYGKDKLKKSKHGKTTIGFYGSSAWRKFSLQYRSSNPLCEKCKDHGLVVEAYCVDHIVELADGGAKLDRSNAMSLCRICHSRKTAKEKRKRSALSI